jgi:hypothetical protein
VCILQEVKWKEVGRCQIWTARRMMDTISRFTCASKFMALVFWDNEGKWLVEFLKGGVTVGSEQYVQIVKNLNHHFEALGLNGDLNQIPILRTFPN